jgi:hypothetical protein
MGIYTSLVSRNGAGGSVNRRSIGYVDDRMLHEGVRGAVGTEALYTVGAKARQASPWRCYGRNP